VAGVPAWPFACAALPAGFAVAVATGVRPLGGLVMVLLAVAALLTPGVQRRPAVLWTGVLLACFVVSHVLGLVIGAWPAVAVVTVICGAAGVVLLDGAAALTPRRSARAPR
jgi:hypothetical protein